MEQLERDKINKISRGDTIFLGGHVLHCGDSSDWEVMKHFKAKSMFTSPPYKMSKNLSWKNKNSELNSKYILPEAITDYVGFLTRTTRLALSSCDFAFVNLQSLSNNKRDILEYLYNLRDHYVDEVIWDKGYTAFPVVPNVLRSDFEHLFIFAKEKSPKRTIRCAPKFHGTISNVQHIRRRCRNKYSDVHNATFPMEFSDFVIESLCGDTVLDMFAGTGTTLMSCEKFNKKWLGIEIVPQYCELIVRRWIENGGNAEKGEKENV